VPLYPLPATSFTPATIGKLTHLVISVTTKTASDARKAETL
jgi:hypothetical protein